MWLFLRASDSVKKIMASAIAVQQHDDVVNLSTISQKKTGYRFAFGKYVIQVSLWHLFGERSSISNQPSLYKGNC